MPVYAVVVSGAIENSVNDVETPGTDAELFVITATVLNATGKVYVWAVVLSFS